MYLPVLFNDHSDRDTTVLRCVRYYLAFNMLQLLHFRKVALNFCITYCEIHVVTCFHVRAGPILTSLLVVANSRLFSESFATPPTIVLHINLDKKK